jgi:hypothetical protein
MEVNIVVVVYKCHLSKKVGAVCVQTLQVQLPKPKLLLLLQQHSLLPTTTLEAGIPVRLGTGRNNLDPGGNLLYVPHPPDRGIIQLHEKEKSNKFRETQPRDVATCCG